MNPPIEIFACPFWSKPLIFANVQSYVQHPEPKSDGLPVRSGLGKNSMSLCIPRQRNRNQKLVSNCESYVTGK